MTRSTPVAILVAPLAAPVVVGSLMLVSLLSSGSDLNDFTAVMLYGGIYLSTLLSYAVMVLAFLPLSLRFSRYGWTRGWQHGALGLAVGLVPFVTWYVARATLFTNPASPHRPAFELHALFWCSLAAVCGLASGWVFWLLAIRTPESATSAT